MHFSVADHRSKYSHERRAFTLVELLVVIAIIGVLVSLLLPAINAAREAARRSTCENNLHQIGISLQSYHEANKHFPVGGIEWRPPGDLTLNKRQLAWSAYLLPHLEEVNLYSRIDFQKSFDHSDNLAAAATIVPVYLCPSSIRKSSLSNGRGACDYGGMYGERIVSGNSPPQGIMIYDKAFAVKQITDGISKTIIVGEDSRFPDGQWINGKNIFDQAFAINAAPSFENDIRSEHVNGAFIVFADGSVHFLTETMEVKVLAALCTRARNEIINNF